MKQISLLCCAAVILIASACKLEPKEMLPGVWKITDIKISSAKEAPAEEKKRFEEYMEIVKSNSSFTFKQDSTVELRYAERLFRGKWSVDQQQNVLYIKEDDTGKKRSIKIKELTEDKLEIEEFVDNSTTSIKLEKQN